MISERLKAALAHVEQLSQEEKLPADVQDTLARILEEHLNVARWEVLFADPRSLTVLQKLADEADKEDFLPLMIPPDMDVDGE